MEYSKFKELNIKYSGFLSNEVFVSKNFEGFHVLLMDFKERNNLQDRKFRELLYYYFSGDSIEKKCKCGSLLKFRSIEKGYSQYCSVICSNKNSVDKIKNIKRSRYGDPNYNNTEKFRISIRKKLDLEGDKVLAKRRETKLLNYGDPNYTNTEKIIRSKRKTTIENINVKMAGYSVRALEILGDSAYLINCDKCGKESAMLNSRINARLRSGSDPCPICNNYSTGVSTKEKELGDFIDSLGFKSVRGDRKSLDGMEIDVLIPDLSVGFEYNGLYWHSEFNLEKNYHNKKQNAALGKGIKLINVWEDEWLYKLTIVKSKIKHILGVTPNKIFARKCKVDNVDYNTAKKFINENHIQGFCPFKTAVGLFYGSDLVSVCTFGNRKITGASNHELLRFCNKIDHHIPGGFSRMLSFYVDECSPAEIVTFADRSWSPSEDSVYIMNGFEFIKSTEPNYWYNIDGRRVHRYSYRKDVLVKEGYDRSLSEREIMLDRGIARIYDCGQYKYILRPNKNAS
jgi:hypothetical protein